jgi:hypothetical protein
LLAAVSAALLFVDECSLGLLALALGGAWLFCPHILGKTRRQGLAVLGGLVLVVLGGIALFGGTLGPGTPHYLVEFVTPSSPGSYTPAIPLTDPLGRRYFFWDLLPVLGTLAGGALLFGRLRDRFLAGTWAFHATLTLASLLLFATLFYAGSGRENHRFVTAAMLYSPLIGGVWLVPRLTARPLPRISLGAPVVGRSMRPVPCCRPTIPR